MIEQPTKLRIYSPVMMDNIDFTAEPELEGKAGSTYRGVTIADGGHAINAADGFPGHVLTIDQAPNSDSFNIEFAMTLIKKINSVVLDGHNLLSVYAASLRDSFKIRHSATDVLGALVENEIRYSGLLGKGRSLQRYNGFNSKTTVTDDPNLDFGVGNFSWAGEFRTSADTSGAVTVIWVKGSGPEKYQLVMNTSNGLNFAIRDSGAEVSIDSDNALNDGEWHRYTVTANRSGLMLMKIDGVLQSDTASCPTGSISNSEDLIFGKADADSNYFDGDQKENIPYNRILAPKETEQMAKGYPVPEPLIIGDNSSMNTVGDWVRGTLNSLSIVSGKLRAVNTAQFQKGHLNTGNILIAGHRYLLEWDGSDKTGNWTWKEFNTDLSIVTVTEGTGESHTFVATSDDELGLLASSVSGQIDLVNVYLTDLDTFVTFPLVVDQWGEQGVYVSDFSVDADGFTKNTADPNFSVNGNEDGISGENDCLALKADGGAVEIATAKTGWLTIGERYRIIFDILVTTGSGITNIGIGSGVGRMSGGIDNFVVSAENTWLRGNILEITADNANRAFSAYTTPTGSTLDTLPDTERIYFKNVKIDRIGAVAAYLHDGISEDQAKWLDASSNNLHGVNTNVETIDAPAGDVRGFVISEFDEISNHKFWQMAFNEDQDSALLDILIGLVTGCWYRDYEIAAGGFGGRIGFPGVKMNTNESGRDNPEQMFGEKPDWDIGLRVTDDQGIQDLQEFVQTVKGGLFPFWVTFNPSTENNPVAEPIFERVTLVGSVFPWQFKFGQTLPWDVKLKFNRRLD